MYHHSSIAPLFSNYTGTYRYSPFIELLVYEIIMLQVTAILIMTTSRNRSDSQRIRRNISEGIRIEIVKVAYNTERTSRLVIILKLRFRINVVLYVSDKKKKTSVSNH